MKGLPRPLKKCLFVHYYFIFPPTVLGLCCCMQAFSSCGEWGYSPDVVRELRAVAASLVAGRGLQSAGSWLLCSTWGLPGSGLKPASPASAGGFLPLSHRKPPSLSSEQTPCCNKPSRLLRSGSQIEGGFVCAKVDIHASFRHIVVGFSWDNLVWE